MDEGVLRLRSRPPTASEVGDDVTSALAAFAGARDAYVLLRDPAGALRPAPGFEGCAPVLPAWRERLAPLGPRARWDGALPSPSTGEPAPAHAVIGDDGTIAAVALSPLPDAPLDALARLLPLVAAALRRYDALARRERALRAIVDAAPAVTAYVDADQRYRATSRAHDAEVPGDVVGRRVADVLGAAGYALVRPHVEAALAGAPVAFERRVPGLDGRPRWIRTEYVPDLDARVAVQGFVAQQHDVTARKLAEERLVLLADASRALDASMDLASTAATAARIAIPALADWCGVILSGDDGAPSLAASAQAPGDDRPPIAIPDETGALDHAIARAIATGAAQPLAGALASALVVPLVAPGRALGALVLASRGPDRYAPLDVTLAEELGRRAGVALDHARRFGEERRARARLEDADRRKDEFLAMLGHELRNPLAPIVTALDVMAMRARDVGSRERDVIRRQAEHLTRLVDDLLDVSRITAGKLALRRQPVELADVVAEAIEVVSPLFEQRAQHLDVASTPAGLIVDGDRARLCQVIANLLSNAARYSERGARVRVGAARDRDAAVITVDDDGRGIGPELLPHVFDPFVQAERADDRSHAGLGLGLAIVRGLTELHGGTVSAHSAGLGRGSRFVVRLPLAEIASIDRAPAPAGPAPLRERVLIVDDNRDAADLLGDALRALGCATEVAYDGPGALAIAPSFVPTAALLDLGLPVMDGFELIGRLRARCAAPLRVIAITGYGQPADVARSRAAGFDGHLGKPASLEAIVAELARRP